MKHWGWLTLIACVRVAHADPRFEASGFVGLDYFSDNTQLGNSPDAEQIPGTAPLVGARLGYLALPELWSHDAFRLQLGVEGELALATAFTGGIDGGRMSYFAPVFEWHAHLLLRLAGDSGWLAAARPHLLLGGGGETVASSSPYMKKETDPVVYWGLGVTVPVTSSWQVRIDLRDGLMPARIGSTTSTVELQFGIATTFGLPHRHIPGTRVEPPPQPAVHDEDTDGDGIPDRLDKCPNEPETINGFQDQDGCPESDPDGDGLVGADDKCPTEAEDFDGFQDEDGCPDPDNDGDGILDAADACPNEPETRNGFQDEDGCPDVVPPEVTRALAATNALRFEPGRARITDPGKDVLAPIVALLTAYHHVRLAVIGHPDVARANDLARRRAEAVKWYLVDQGFAADRIETRIGATQRTPSIHVELILGSAPPRP